MSGKKNKSIKIFVMYLMIWLGTHVTRAVASGHAAALNGNQIRECQPETVRKWVAEMSTKALSQLTI